MTTSPAQPPAAANPRPPNAGEREALAGWLQTQGHDRESALGVADAAFAAVFDRYDTGGPGDAGKLMSVVWDGGPSFYDVFTWQGGTMVRHGREYDAKECDRCGATNASLCFNCWRNWSRGR